jgi:Tfp pilus assembly protein PilW
MLTAFWILWVLVGILIALFIICAIGAVVSSSRETREENAAQFDPAGKDGRGRDHFGRW